MKTSAGPAWKLGLVGVRAHPQMNKHSPLLPHPSPNCPSPPLPEYSTLLHCDAAGGTLVEPFSLMNSGESGVDMCRVVISQMYKNSIQHKIFRVRRVLTYWMYSVWFWRGVASGQRILEAGYDAKRTLQPVRNLPYLELVLRLVPY